MLFVFCNFLLIAKKSAVLISLSKLMTWRSFRQTMQSSSGGVSTMDVPEVIVRPISEPLHETGTSTQMPVHPSTRTPERKTSHGVLKSNSMRVPRITERRHTLPPRQGSIDEISSSGDSAHSIYTRSVKVRSHEYILSIEPQLTWRYFEAACFFSTCSLNVFPVTHIIQQFLFHILLVPCLV